MIVVVDGDDIDVELFLEVDWEDICGPFLDQVFHDDFPILIWIFEDSDGVVCAVFQVGEKRTVFMILDAPFLKEGIGGVCLGWVSFSIYNIYKYVCQCGVRMLYSMINWGKLKEECGRR